MRPARSGFIITPSITMSEPGVTSAATMGKAADDGSAGTTTGRALSSGRPVRVIRRPSPPARRDFGAEMDEHFLGMVARGLAFDDGGRGRARSSPQAAPPI